MSDQADTDTAPPPPTKIAYEFIKSTEFRVIHADGVMGGPTPQGQLFFSLFSERPPIPQKMVHAVERVGDPDATGAQKFKLGPEIPAERVQRDGIVREVEVGVMLTMATARALRDWLSVNLEQSGE